MLGFILAGFVGFILGIVTVGAILFVKMARRNAALEKWQRKIADGVAHGLAMQQTVYGEELDSKRQEYTRTRQMLQRDMGVESDLIEGADIRRAP